MANCWFCYKDAGEKEYHQKCSRDFFGTSMPPQLKLNNQFAEAYLLRGSARYYSNELDKALLDFSEAILIDPDYHNAFIERGICLNKMKRPEEAISDLKKAYSLFPTNYLSLVDLIEILFVNGKKEEAASYLEKANKLLWPNDQSIIFTLFSWLFKRTDNIDAEQELNTITSQIKLLKDINYNFSEIRDWLSEATLDAPLKKEITDVVNWLDATNKNNPYVI